ncbi:hypothetical protein C6990_09550 [Nitrosopumilus sp. b3]|uniref:hypothetical protein n=1 Tax=Nitrosopumilus sp. b3 TaxID=2109909 RepID=UPI0015F3CFBD|nr:hypothetical protein [Nitrosopumilus sp. b3]KAF6246362.1 hypothetical protein C6990_09550 [Nitrosopumilus sp. b3]
MVSEPPILGYDDRYFLDRPYTREELFELQRQILSIIKRGSSDIEKDLKTTIDHKEIDTCLRKCYSKQLIKRERLGVENKVPIYRYYNIET